MENYSKLYTATELAKLKNVHRSTVYLWVKNGLPVVPKGRQALFDLDQVAAWEIQYMEQRGRKMELEPCGQGRV